MRLRKVLEKHNEILASIPEKPGNFKRRFTLAELEAAYDASGGSCMVCGAKPGKSNLALDHCHDTGKLRGILCLKCNMGIGQLNDDPDLLDKAAAYLRRFK